MSSSVWLHGLRRLLPGEPLPMLPRAGLLLVSSSAEVGLLVEPQCRSWLSSLARSSPGTPLHMLSIGCAGVAACVLEFMHSSACSAHVMVVETPTDWVQTTLDVAGVGAGGDEFKAQDAAFVFTLSRGARPESADALKLLYSGLLAREPNVGGTAQLAARLANLVATFARIYPDMAAVGFQNGSQWSRHLSKLVNLMLEKKGLPGMQHWLPSQEIDLRHFMSARPLLDLQAHSHHAGRAPLLLPCLGAGGRVGMLLLGPWDRDGAAIDIPVPQPLDLPEPSSSWWADKPVPPTQVLYAQREYFGRPQFYFRWRMSSEPLFSA